MALSTSFFFSQSNLQDYNDCPRRFYLKYIRKLAWPAVESEPVQDNEHFRLQGELFHKLIHQFFLGIPAEKLSALATDALLAGWWENFLQSQKELFQWDEAAYLPEQVVTTTLEGFRLLAKYDLFVMTKQGTYLIYDWKTYRRRPHREQIAQKVQTRLYPFTLLHSGHFLPQIAPSVQHPEVQRFANHWKLSDYLPENLKLVYWYANYPGQPEIFTYTKHQFQQDQLYLSRLIRSIANLAQSEQTGDFPMTTHSERCLFCVYRSLCDRGSRAGDWDQDLPETELQVTLDDFDFEHISEIEF